MTFQIDTGTENRPTAWRIDRGELLMQSVHDDLPDNAAQEQIDDLLTQYIIGELAKPKTAATVRRRFAQYWPLIAPLAERAPDAFDSVIMEMAEILS
jgi:hypothetical protein